MLKASYKKYILKFRQPSGTSRGVLTEKTSYFVKMWKEENPEIVGIGECSLIKGLSIDDRADYEDRLKEYCDDVLKFINKIMSGLEGLPSISFGLETALFDLNHGGKRIIFGSEFTEGKAGIPINGLIWMGDIGFMKEQIKSKLKEGFKCLKIKIGSIKFDEELKLLSDLRKEYLENDLEIRLDANGSFRINEALENLNWLSSYKIHSIEQPIRQGNREEMAMLCKKSPIPIALDEELIGYHNNEVKLRLLRVIKPQYIILKPSLLGGMNQCSYWIEGAQMEKIGWWVTSALESNIGLNAIAQWTTTLKNEMPHGLGTGQLYTNNIASPLVVENAKLWSKGEDWDVSQII